MTGPRCVYRLWRWRERVLLGEAVEAFRIYGRLEDKGVRLEDQDVLTLEMLGLRAVDASRPKIWWRGWGTAWGLLQWWKERMRDWAADGFVLPETSLTAGALGGVYSLEPSKPSEPSEVEAKEVLYN